VTHAPLARTEMPRFIAEHHVTTGREFHLVSGRLTLPQTTGLFALEFLLVSASPRLVQGKLLRLEVGLYQEKLMIALRPRCW